MNRSPTPRAASWASTTMLLMAVLSASAARSTQAGPMAAPAETTNWLTRDEGARVASFSSEFGAGWVADNLVPSREQLEGKDRMMAELIWSSGSSEPFPHWILIDLGQRRWLTTLVFNNALLEEADHPGISARHVQVWMGEEASALRKVAAFDLARNQDGQEIAIEPVQARWLKVVVESNWGHPWYTEMGPLLAFDDGRRPGDIASQFRATGTLDLYGLYFDFGSAELRDESAPTLDAVSAMLRADPALRLGVEGHTDAVGNDAANVGLSRERAEAVVQALVRRGIAPQRLEARGWGAAQPVADNDTPSGRARNRRVAIVKLP